MIYINTQQQNEHRKRLKRLQEALGCAMQSAYACFYEPLEANETLEDRAVYVKEKLFDQAMGALIEAWDGEPSELVECIQDKLGIRIPLMGRLIDDGHGKYTIEWAKGE